MRRQDICLYLNPADRAKLEEIVASRNSPRKWVWRADIVLASADGLGTNAIMRRTGKSKPCVWRWQERYIDQGVPGLLRDKTRPSRIAPLSAWTKRRKHFGPKNASRNRIMNLAEKLDGLLQTANGNARRVISRQTIASLLRVIVSGRQLAWVRSEQVGSNLNYTSATIAACPRISRDKLIIGIKGASAYKSSPGRAWPELRPWRPQSQIGKIVTLRTGCEFQFQWRLGSPRNCSNCRPQRLDGILVCCQIVARSSSFRTLPPLAVETAPMNRCRWCPPTRRPLMSCEPAS